MSKAFTKEDDGNEDDLGVPDPSDQPRSKGANHITMGGFRAMQQELERLWKVERPRVTEEVSVAAAQGDRSENAEYIYGKKKLREIDRRIRFLTRRLDTVTVAQPSTEQLGKIYFGSWFTIEDEEGVRSTYRIVGTDEIDVAARKISIRAPLAQALLGKAEGDDAVVQRPKGPTEVTVVKVWYETDS